MVVNSDPALNHEYLPIAGLATFTSASAKLMFGAESPVIKENRVSLSNSQIALKMVD